MNKNLPRYKTNLFISHEKHITRTLKTYIKYEDIKQIYLTFNPQEDKYQLHLKIDATDEMPGNDNLFYDREDANMNLSDISLILKVIDKELESLYKKDFLEQLKFFGESQHKKNKEFLFLKNEINIVNDLLNILNNTQSKSMIAKRLYNTIFNKLTHKRRISSLSNSVVISKNNAFDECNIEIQHLKHKIERINHLYKTFDRYETYETLDSINTQIDNYNNPRFENSQDIEDLLLEKSQHEENQIKSIKEENLLNRINHQIKEVTSDLFGDYIKIKALLDKEGKNFTSNALTRYSKNLIYDVNVSEKLSGIKKKLTIVKLKEKYTSNYKRYYHLFLNDNEGKRLFIYKMKALHKEQELLSILTKEDINELKTKNEITNKLVIKEYIPKMTAYEQILYLKGLMQPLINDARENHEMIFELEDNLQEYLDFQDSKEVLEIEYKIKKYQEHQEKIELEIRKIKQEIYTIEEKEQLAQEEFEENMTTDEYIRYCEFIENNSTI